MSDTTAEPRPWGHRAPPTSADDRGPVAVAIANSGDIIVARQHGRDLALEMGFSNTESVLIATAISELTRNIVVYANAGEVRLERIHERDRDGMTILARDEGPGIRNLQRVLTGGYSTSGGLGLGVAGVRQMMDEFTVETGIGKGTAIFATKWLR